MSMNVGGYLPQSTLTTVEPANMPGTSKKTKKNTKDKTNKTVKRSKASTEQVLLISKKKFIKFYLI